jgi:hypothetical protein
MKWMNSTSLQSQSVIHANLAVNANDLFQKQLKLDSCIQIRIVSKQEKRKFTTFKRNVHIRDVVQGKKEFDLIPILYKSNAQFTGFQVRGHFFRKLKICNSNDERFRFQNLTQKKRWTIRCHSDMKPYECSHKQTHGKRFVDSAC